MTADEIIANLTRLYANCSSYSDSGAVTTTGDAPDPGIKFKTYFVRPAKFRFEWTSYRGRQVFDILWSDGVTTHAFHFGQLKECQSLGFAIAGATGISFGSARNVSALLMAEIGAGTRNPLHLIDLSVLREEQMHGRLCCVIQGHHTSDSLCTELWIDKANFVLRRISESYLISVSQQQETYAELQSSSGSRHQHRRRSASPLTPKKFCTVADYLDVVIDAPIDDSVFTYTPD